MTGALDGAVELLERSLAYTRVALADVRADDLDRPTPCAGWSLGRLLRHMEDSLDAFTEAAAGRVDVEPVAASATGVEALREKACALLGAWTAARAAPGQVAVGDLGLDAPLLVAAAALEITVHGWDVGRATGRRARIPEDLARGLLGVAHHVIGGRDRGLEFAGPRPVPSDAPADERLLAWTGRVPEHRPAHMTEPLPGNSGEPPSRGGLAS